MTFGNLEKPWKQFWGFSFYEKFQITAAKAHQYYFKRKTKKESDDSGGVAMLSSFLVKILRPTAKGLKKMMRFFGALFFSKPIGLNFTAS